MNHALIKALVHFRLDVGVGGGYLKPRLVRDVIGLDIKRGTGHGEGAAGVRSGQCACGVDSKVKLWTDTHKERSLGFRQAVPGESCSDYVQWLENKKCKPRIAPTVTTEKK